MTHYCIIKTPLDRVMLTAEANELTGLYFVDCAHAPAPGGDWMMDPQHAVLERAREELCEYFEGRRTVFSVPMRIAGTAFQERVWREIALIPFGETISYAELARRAGAPEAIRAAGMATGRNRIGVMIPCHRVMGKNGTLTGYAGGVERKRRLLELEGGGENYEV